MKSRTKYRIWTYTFVIVFAIFGGVGVLCENCEAFIRWVQNFCPGLVSVIRYDFGTRGEGLLSISSIIWTVTAGAVFFVIQYGYGKKMGLNMYDILILTIHKVELIAIAFLMGIKLLVYGYSYIQEMKWLLFFLTIEGMVSLVFLVWLMVSLTDIQEIVKLILEHMNTETEKSEKKNFHKVLLKVVKCMHYDDYEEVDGLVACIVRYIENLDDINNKIGIDNIEIEDVCRWKVQVNIIRDVMDSVYAGTQGGKKMLNIMQQCVLKLSQADAFKTYLLMKSLISRSIYKLEPNEIKQIVESILGENQEKVRKYMGCYLEFMIQNTTERAWAEILKNELGFADMNMSATAEYIQVETLEYLLTSIV